MGINMIRRAGGFLGGVIVGAVMVTVFLGAVTVEWPTAAAETAPAVTVVAPDRSYRPGDSEPFYAVWVSPEDIDPETGQPHTIEGVAIRALIDGGAMGAVNDGDDSFVYARVGTVKDFGYGTVTVTAFGIRVCADGDDGRCTGTEFDPWSPNV